MKGNTGERTTADERAASRNAEQKASSDPQAARDRKAADWNKKSWWQLIKTTFSDWSNDKAPRLGAALAYYSVFSIAPLLVIVIAVAGLIFGTEAVQGTLDQEIQGMLGERGAEGVSEMVEAAHKSGGGILATVLSVVALVFGASGVFGQLQDALNTIWEVEPKPGRGIWGMVRDRFLSFAMVLCIAFLLLVSLVVSAVLSAATAHLNDLIPGPDIIAHLVNFVVSLAVLTLLFALMFKYLPDVKIGWKDVWLGAFVTAILFSIGKYALGAYLGRSAVASAYGAAGSLIVVLLWAYYASQILLMGAEFTQAYASMYGSRIEPAENAMAVEKRQ